MNVRELSNNFTTNLNEASPRIKVFLGVGGLLVAGVLACKATLKVKEETEEERKSFRDIYKIRKAQRHLATELLKPNNEDIQELPEEKKVSRDVMLIYTDKDYAKDVVKTSISYGKKLTKLYGIPICLTALAIALIFNGTNTLNSRYLAVSSAYASLNKAFETYRERVKDRYGEEVEKDIRYGLKTEKIKEEVVDEESGKKKTVIKEVKVAENDPTACSPYAFIFDERFNEFTGDINYDETFAKAKQAVLNDKLLLSSRRYLVLDNLNDEFGAPEEMYTGSSMRAGWTRGKDDNSDAFIDLRIQRIYIEKDGIRVPRILIDPNVEGDIYSKIVKKNGYSNE